MKICFIALGVNSLFNPKHITRIIGPDVHQYLLGNELIKHDFLISYITYCDEFNSNFRNNTKIELICIKEPIYSINFLNIFIKAINIWNAMIRSNSTIFYQAGGVPGIIGIFCKLLKKTVIYEISSDIYVQVKGNGFLKKFLPILINLEKLGNFIDIYLSDFVIVQTNEQKKLLKENFQKEGYLIKMAFPITTNDAHQEKYPLIIVWIGTIAHIKQPQIFIEIAKNISNQKFVMIGGESDDPNFFTEIKCEAEKIPNMQFLGSVEFHKIDIILSECSILVNTSCYEGYPNAFIQAMIHSIPIVSLNANPDNILTNYNMGFHSQNFKQMVQDIQKLIDNPNLLKKMGQNGRNYAEKEHDLEKNIYQLIDLITRKRVSNGY